MKALPLWQPWASLVAVEAKRIETRSWPAPAWLIGERVAIHATKTPAHLWNARREAFRRRLREARNADLLVLVDGELPLGAIIATAVVSCCREITVEKAELLAAHNSDEFVFGDYTPGRYAWMLRDVERLDTPIPVRGSQGLFDIPDQLLGHDPKQGLLL